MYFGGGTPSQLSAALLGRIVRKAEEVFGFDTLDELTIEANPDDLSQEWIDGLKEAIPQYQLRISMGIQTFDDALLCLLGRRHTAQQAIDAVHRLQDNGITEATYCPPKGYFAADENPEAFEAYEATFPPKEKAFQEGQLPQFCQSCGMPLTRIEDCGTRADGSTNFDYCLFCYKEGKFLQDCTMDEMIEHCSQFADEVNKPLPKPMTKEEYKQMMHSFFPMLKRWRK